MLVDGIFSVRFLCAEMCRGDLMARLASRAFCVRPEGAAPGAGFSQPAAVQASEGFSGCVGLYLWVEACACCTCAGAHILLRFALGQVLGVCGVHAGVGVEPSHVGLWAQRMMLRGAHGAVRGVLRRRAA